MEGQAMERSIKEGVEQAAMAKLNCIPYRRDPFLPKKAYRKRWN